jgi:hypothetical protein
MIRYLNLYIADEDETDNHRFLRRLFEEGGDPVLRSLAKLAPGRQELGDLLPTLKSMGACFYLAAVKSAKARGQLAKAASEDLSLYLYGIEYDRLKRSVDTLRRLSAELTMVNASALASPVYRLLDEDSVEGRTEARDLRSLPGLLQRYADRLGEFFATNSKLRLPHHYDLGTAHEYVVIDEIQKATGTPQYSEVATILESVYAGSVPPDLRRFLPRAFDEKTVADRRRRFRSAGGVLSPLFRLGGILNALAEDLYAGTGLRCPSCGGNTLKFAMAHPTVDGSESQRRTLWCRTPRCDASVDTEERLVSQYPPPSPEG